MKTSSVLFRTTKFVFAAILGIVFISSASAAVTIPSTIDTMLDLNGETQSVKDKKDAFFGDGGGIKNGTLNVTFYKDVWWSMVGKTFTVGAGGKLTVKPSSGTNKSCEMNFQGGGTLIIDGGTVVNENNRGSSYGQYFGCDQKGNGELRIVNGGTFTSKNLFVRIGYNKEATGILSIDKGTINVPNNKLMVACEGATGIVAVTNAVINSGDIELCESSSYVAQLRFVDSELNIPRIWANKDPASGSFCIMDGCTNNATYTEMLSNLKTIPYQLEGKGLIANPSVDSDMKGYYVARATDRGTGPIVKIGDKTLKVSGVLDGTKAEADTTGVTDYQVLGGVLDISGGTYLPIGQLNLTAKTGGRFEGGIGSDLTAAYNSLTIDGTVTIPLTFDENGCSQIKATTLILDTTDENPVTLECSGSFTEGVEYCIRENFSEDDVAKLKVTGLDAKVVYRDGNLYVEPNQRANGTVVWQGGLGDNWWDADKWLLDASSTTFVNGDAAIFNTENAAAVLDKDAAVTGLYVTNNVTITGEKTLTSPIIEVTATKTATIAAPLSADFAKTGEGELILKDYASGKALNLKEGQVALTWSDEPGTNPFSTENQVNTIAGTLDLGGAEQTFGVNVIKTDNLLRSGAEFRNGTVNLNFTTDNWMTLLDVSFVVGPGATFNTLPDGEGSGAIRKGELNLTGNSQIIIDKGTFNNNNRRTGEGNDIGNDAAGTAMLRVTNGGTFNSVYNYVQLGVKADATGILSGDHGTINISEGKKALVVGVGGTTNTAGIVALTNSVLKVNEITLCKSLDGVTAQFTLVDTVAYLQRMETLKKPSDTSFVLFDGATLVAKEERADFLPDLKVPTTIGAKGLTISNDYNVTISAPLTGEGKLTKMGAGKLTFSGAQSYKGGLEVCEGSIGATLMKDGFATKDLDLMLNLAEGKKLKIDIAGTPEPGENYTLFNSGITEETLPLLEIDANYELSLEDGQLKVKLMPLSLTWTGEGETNLWSTVANWRNATREPAKFDTVIFDGESGETEYDLENGLLFTEIDVNSGAWTTKVDQASFANTPIALAQGASFTLTGAKVTNPFSTAKNANAIEGTLDLGGGSQTLADPLADNTSGSFRNGGTIKNGEVTLGSSDNIELHNVAFTFGTNAIVSSSSLFNMGRGGYLKIDGGSFSTSGSSNLSDAGSYIGNYGNATIEILNGSFSHTKERLYIGRAHREAGNGAIYGLNAEIDLDKYELIMGDKNKSTSTLMLTNSTLTCKYIRFGLNGSSNPGKQTLEFIGSTLKLGQIASEKVASGSSITFDGATIEDNGAYTALLQVLGIPYTIAEGGLTVKVANIDTKKEEDYVSFPGTFNGAGDFTLVAADKTPREVKFTNEAVKGFTGNLIVSDKITVTADGKTFKGGLVAKSGSTLNVATSVFEGEITLEDGVTFATEGVTMDEHMTSGVLVAKAKGKITLPEGALRNKDTRNGAYVVEKNGYSELYYGRKLALVLMVR